LHFDNPGKPLNVIERIAQSPHALSVEQLAAILNVSRKSIYKLISHGRLPCFRLGGLIRFSPHHVAAYLETV
jgi:excisionase family DNA binding protein